MVISQGDKFARRVEYSSCGTVVKYSRVSQTTFRLRKAADIATNLGGDLDFSKVPTKPQRIEPIEALHYRTTKRHTE